MSCVVRVAGDQLDIDALLALIKLPADAIRRKGQPRGISGRLHTTSGANFFVSDADFDEFGQQLKDATVFLDLHRVVLLTMVDYPGVESTVLDFGVSLSRNCFARSSRLPPSFIRAAAAIGIGVEISCYLCDDDETQADP